MEWIEIDGKQVPLLEPPDSYKEMPRRGLQVAFKYKRVIRNVFLMVSVPLLLIVLLAPQKYRGTARVFIKSNRVLGPDSSLNNAATEALLNTEIQLIRSREVLRQLSKELPFPVQGWLDVGSPTKIEATPVKATSIIQIGLISTNPEWAAKVVNRAAELHQAQSLNVRKTQGIEKFYDEQDRRLRGDLLRAEQDLKKFQEREGVIDAPKEVDASLSALAFAEKSVKDTDAAIRETEKRITVLDQQLKAQQPTVLSSKSVSVDPVYAAIRARLTQLELERQGLLQRYLPKDRLIVDKEREIAELKKQLEEAEKTTVGSENITLNTVHQRILNELLAARVQLQALKEKRASDASHVSSYSAMATDKKKKSFEYERLQQVVNAKREALALYLKKAEEARISDAMDEQKFSNVVILDRASLPLSPAGYSTLVWILIITFLATATAIAAAFIMNYFDPTVQDETYVEREFGLPVLATIEHYDSQQPGYFIPAN